MSVREGSRSARELRGDPKFRDALQQCEEACQALAAASLAVSMDRDAASHEHRFRECWHMAMTTATALAYFDRHDLETIFAVLGACERLARWTAELAALTPASSCCRCGDLAAECAGLCTVLVRWFAPMEKG